MYIYSAYESTDQYDLLNAFERAIVEDNTLAEYQHFNFSDYYRIWVNEPGYPVLDVTINHLTGEMNLEQVSLKPIGNFRKRIHVSSQI